MFAEHWPFVGRVSVVLTLLLRREGNVVVVDMTCLPVAAVSIEERDTCKDLPA